MKSRSCLLVAVAVSSLVFTLSLQAKQLDPTPSVKADSKDQFAAVSDHVRELMAPGGRFEFVNTQERATVDTDLAQMQSLFDKFGTVDAMDAASRIQLYNNQSEVNAILTRRDGDREICDQEKSTGSNIPKTICRTYSDMERERTDTKNTKQNMQQVQNVCKGIPGPFHNGCGG
jgi:hypothetical protein